MDKVAGGDVLQWASHTRSGWPLPVIERTPRRRHPPWSPETRRR